MECDKTIDGDENTVWVSGLNKPDYQDSNTHQNGKTQWGYNTNVKVIFKKKTTVVSGIQIINKVDKEDFYENYKEMKIEFSNGYKRLVTLSSHGKHNDILHFEQPVETSFVNVCGISTFGHMPENHKSGLSSSHTGFRSGLSEIRIFGCDKNT